MKIKKDNFILWLLIATSILLNHNFRLFLKWENGQVFWSLPIVGSIQYGDYLIQKWFLVIIGFVIFVWWLKKYKNPMKIFRKNLYFIMIILLVTFTVHIFSFYRWFEFDDYRVIGHHYAVSGTPNHNQMGAGSSYYYGIGLIYLVVNWFDTNFELYNGLGLFIYFLIGVTIFFISEKLGRSKITSLVIALFFVTSPTYFREMLLMLELLGDGFKLLLFAIACFFLIAKFYPGAVIFAAAALEFGISRTHFIGLPLILMSFLFREKKEIGHSWFISVLAFFLMSLSYIGVLKAHPPTILDETNLVNNWQQLLRITDMVFGVTIPHTIIYVTLSFLNRFLDNNIYISPIIGTLIIVGLLYLALTLYLKKKVLESKLIFIGVTIIIAAIIFPTLMGIRLVYRIDHLTAQYNDLIPAAPTAYGVFSTFGTIFVLLSLSYLFKHTSFIKILILLIFLNAATIIRSDLEWVKNYSKPQRVVNEQLNDLLPYDGKTKVVYTPPPTEVLSKYVSYFYQLYRIKESLNFTNDPNEFIRLLTEFKPDRDRVYLLLLNRETHQIIDLSYKVRNYYPEKKLTPEILNLVTK